MSVGLQRLPKPTYWSINPEWVQENSILLKIIQHPYQQWVKQFNSLIKKDA